MTVRVLHVITRMILGGAQENTLLSVEGLHQRPEYDVDLLSGVDEGLEGELLTRARKSVRVIVVPELCRSVSPVADAMALGKLYRAIRAGGYHIVHTHSSKAGVLGRVAARLAGAPIVVHTLHSLVFHDYQPWLVNRALWAAKKACAPMTDHFISVSEAVRRKALAERIGRPEQHTTIYSGMELDWFLHAAVDGATIRRELGISLDAPVVGKIARLFPLKGHEQFLDAAPAIVEGSPTVRFLLVGDGVLRERLQDRARRLGILDHFVFAGLVGRERIPAMLAAMDVVVHTSLREGLARVLPQALAMGRPCVTFDLDGAPEVVVPGRTGFLVRPGDTSGLAAAVVQLLQDPALRQSMGQEGRRLVDPMFRAEKMVQDIAALYSSLIGRYRRRIERFERRRIITGKSLEWAKLDQGYGLRRRGKQ